ncbi:hypothetical protein SynRS9909_01179 [Synechococcus sp. RS9909]|nr:hypothetical protein SynRS9909_01179 [Synechococcus sp. RS9909]
MNRGAGSPGIEGCPSSVTADAARRAAAFWLPALQHPRQRSSVP